LRALVTLTANCGLLVPAVLEERNPALARARDLPTLKLDPGRT